LCETAAVRYIEDDSQLDAALETLRRGDVYFIDTEFESNKRSTTLSLVQVSVAERSALMDTTVGASAASEPLLMDALKVRRLTELGPVMLREGVEWVLHAGLQDVELLLECFRLPKPPKLFDTQIAWSLLGPEANVSLSYLLFRLLGLRTMKSHQADNWMRRPLPASQLEYAGKDIEHLPALYLKLQQSLAEMGKSDAVSKACNELLWPKPELPLELSLESFRNAWQLEPENQAALRFLIEWYNQLPAFERERAPVPKTMLSIASRLPQNAKELLRIKGLPPQFSTGYAEALVRGMSRAVSNAKKEEFVRIDPEPYATFEDILLEAWLSAMRAEVSHRACVAPELGFPVRVQRALRAAVREHGPRAVNGAIEGWRKELLGSALTEFVERAVASGQPRLGSCSEIAAGS
jgi:ribonuclease D